MSGKMVSYARAVASLNDHRLRRQPCAVMSLFHDVAASVEDTYHAEICGCWQLLRCMVDERDTVNGEFQGTELFEQHYRDGYLARPGSPARAQLIDMLTSGACVFLEQHFLRHVRDTVLHQQRQPNAQPIAVPGAPGDLKYIQAYAQLQYRDGWPRDLVLVGNSPIWFEIYLCLRCGLLPLALEVALSTEQFVTGDVVELLRELSAGHGRQMARCVAHAVATCWARC